ncbi:hypothetical protein N8D56_22790 [Devosia sp. A8/3-2]|nr:hypothetical protein N8D56_22790 [Devosia sp. A8/3-2]
MVSRRTLQYGKDYSFDYLQGIVILKSPLSRQTGTMGPVRDGAFGGSNVYLIAQYEFVPAADDVDGYVYGGRAQHWFNDNLRVGVTGMSRNHRPCRPGGLRCRCRIACVGNHLPACRNRPFRGAGLWPVALRRWRTDWGEHGTAGIANKSAPARRVEGRGGPRRSGLCRARWRGWLLLRE